MFLDVWFVSTFPCSRIIYMITVTMLCLYLPPSLQRIRTPSVMPLVKCNSFELHSFKIRNPDTNIIIVVMNTNEWTGTACTCDRPTPFLSIKTISNIFETDASRAKDRRWRRNSSTSNRGRRNSIREKKEEEDDGDEKK